MSDGGDWDRWENWVPGDPVPSGPLPADMARRSESGRQRRRLPEPPSQPPRRSATASSRSGASSGIAASVFGALVVSAGVGAAAFVALGSEPQDGASGAAQAVVTTAPYTTTEHDGDVEGVPAPTSTLPASTPVAGGPDLVHVSLAPALELLASEVGVPLRVQRLIAYPDYLVATIEPPDLPGELDRWVVYPPDRATGPDPQSSPGAVDAELFDPSELDLPAVATLSAQAVAELGIEPDTTYLIMERSAAYSRQLTVTVYVSNERRSGYVRFATDGSILDAQGE